MSDAEQKALDADDNHNADSGNTQDMTNEEDDTLTNVTELNEEKSSKKTKGKPKSSSKEEKEEKRRKFFEEELKRLKRKLDEESTKIKAPPVQDHVPYCFNTLAPYYNTVTAEHVILKTGDDGKLKDTAAEYATRKTAIGLVDPWVSHKMDKELAPKVKVKEHAPFKNPPKREKRIGEGSTMIPAFPTFNMDIGDIESRMLNYNDVPMLRKELREKYSSQGKAKIEKDYERMKNDFYRMELHKLQDVHPMNRGNMKAAYFAYLQNTPGSKKALQECVKKIVEEKDDAGSEKGENTENEKPKSPTEDQQQPAEEAEA